MGRGADEGVPVFRSAGVGDSPKRLRRAGGEAVTQQALPSLCPAILSEGGFHIEEGPGHRPLV